MIYILDVQYNGDLNGLGMYLYNALGFYPTLLRLF